MLTRTLSLSASCLLTACGSVNAQALDAATRAQGNAIADRAITYLMSQQDPQTGGFSIDPRPNAYQFPAITGLVLQGAAMDDGFDPDDPKIKHAVEFILSFQQSDGGIYDRVLASYNTAICVSALAAIDRDAYDRSFIKPAVRFLRSLQWSEDAADRDDTGVVDRDHPFYGGVGYGRSNRPDNSNLNLMLQALHDAGVSDDDPAFQRALVFLQRTQMVDAFNDMDYADGSNQGGFIYATSPDGARLGIGESKAGMIDEIDESLEGETVSRLRAYGSMTYAGFKSFAYAGLSESDPRVRAARSWLEHNYTMDENPGLGTDGQYYYYMTLGRALGAWGDPTLDAINTVPVSHTISLEVADLTFEPMKFEITTLTTKQGDTYEFSEPIRTVDVQLKDQPDGASGPPVVSSHGATIKARDLITADERTTMSLTNIRVSQQQAFKDSGDGAQSEHVTLVFEADALIDVDADWRADLISKLAKLQNPDGSFLVLDDRWMESNPVLITAYALIGLQAALDVPDSP